METDLQELRRLVRERLLADPQHEVDRALVAHLVEQVAPLFDRPTLDQLTGEILDGVYGLGPLEPFLADDSVTDLMVNSDRGVWIERGGRLIETGLVFDRAEVYHLIERIVSPLGLRVDRASPMVDARLSDGSRVNAIVPPLAIDGPVLTVRRFSSRTIPLENLAEPAIASLLRKAVRARQNIVISGATGAGKTTLLNAMAAEIGATERVITIEDTAELRLPLAHVVRLEARPANSEGAGEVTLRQLVRNALRMRPDRIIVGETRGPEALDMLQAMNTGHEGSLSTCHANSAAGALYRLETMVLMGDIALPLFAVRQQIVTSLDLVVQIAKASDGSRRVVNVSEVVDLTDGTNSLQCRQLADEFCVLANPVRPERRPYARRAA